VREGGALRQGHEAREHCSSSADGRTTSPRSRAGGRSRRTVYRSTARRPDASTASFRAAVLARRRTEDVVEPGWVKDLLTPCPIPPHSWPRCPPHSADRRAHQPIPGVIAAAGQRQRELDELSGSSGAGASTAKARSSRRSRGEHALRPGLTVPDAEETFRRRQARADTRTDRRPRSGHSKRYARAGADPRRQRCFAD